ncbi:CYB5 protein, partial [Acromyrmex insinuator]
MRWGPDNEKNEKEGNIELYKRQTAFRSAHASAVPRRGSRTTSYLGEDSHLRLICTVALHFSLDLSPSVKEVDVILRNTPFEEDCKEEKAKGHRDMAEMKVFTRNEIKKNDDKDKVLFILHDKVYNVRSFLNEHPGGEEILLEHKGIDASEDFDDVGHSKDAMELMKTYQVGVIADSERMNKLPKKGWTSGYVKETGKNVQGFSLSSYLLMGGIALVAVLFFYVY